MCVREKEKCERARERIRERERVTSGFISSPLHPSIPSPHPPTAPLSLFLTPSARGETTLRAYLNNPSLHTEAGSSRWRLLLRAVREGVKEPQPRASTRSHGLVRTESSRRQIRNDSGVCSSCARLLLSYSPYIAPETRENPSHIPRRPRNASGMFNPLLSHPSEQLALGPALPPALSD